jgi:signal transduction histidine kinase
MRHRILEEARSRLSSVRARSAVAAASVVAAVVGVAGIGVLLGARAFLAANVESTTTQRAQQLAAVVSGGDLNDLAGLPDAGPADQTVVQVLDPAGNVLAASPELAGRPAITALRPATGVVEQEQATLDPRDTDPTQVVALGVDTPDGRRVVVVAQSLRPTHETLEFLTSSAIAGVPALAVAVGLATFVFVGRSLRPVETIRRRVASITGHDLRARVPTPKTHDEVAALADTMNAMLDRLQSAVESQRRFVADASHELRNPLATLRVGLDVLATQPGVPDQQVRRLLAETDRLGQLVADLLLLARADENGLASRNSDVDLDDLAYRAQQRLRTSAPNLRVEVRLDPVRVRGDGHQLERAIANLCDNASRHAKTMVAIDVAARGDLAHLTVSDDGAGIDPADWDRIFDRFVRLDDSRTRSAGGAGLGLAITREIAQRHGGSVTVDASPAGGARFDLWLPLPAAAPFDEGAS